MGKLAFIIVIQIKRKKKPSNLIFMCLFLLKIYLIFYRLKNKLEDVIFNITKVKQPAYRKYIEFEISGETEDGTDAIMPTIRYLIKK